MSDKKCEIHGTALKPTEVGISYGLRLLDEELMEARRSQFPHSRRSVNGDCLAGAAGNRAGILVCEKCTEAETAWNAIHRPHRNQRSQMAIFREELRTMRIENETE